MLHFQQRSLINMPSGWVHLGYTAHNLSVGLGLFQDLNILPKDPMQI